MKQIMRPCLVTLALHWAGVGSLMQCYSSGTYIKG